MQHGFFARGMYSQPLRLLFSGQAAEAAPSFLGCSLQKTKKPHTGQGEFTGEHLL
jgi:hypothetical protein